LYCKAQELCVLSCSNFESLCYVVVVVVALQERDVDEGADMLMVKPGTTYLDIARQIKDKVCSLTVDYLIMVRYNC